MTATQFWEEDPWLAAAYRRASQLHNQRKSEEMWLQGLYNYHALSVVLGNAFAKKGAKRLEYLDEPIRLLPLTEEEKAERAEKERRKVIAYFDRLAKQWESIEP